MTYLSFRYQGIQLLRGVIPYNDPNGGQNVMRFSDIYNSFLTFYQLFSTENWTNVLYSALNYESIVGSPVTAVIAALFLVAYVTLSNFILLNMFIAVIEENFEVAEKEKHKRQLETFRRNIDPSKKDDIAHRWNVYKYFEAKPKALVVESFPSNLVLHVQKNRVRDFLNYGCEKYFGKKDCLDTESFDRPDNLVTRINRFFGVEIESDQIPLLEQIDRQQSPDAKDSQGGGGLLMGEQVNDNSIEAFMDDYNERQALKADFIAAHPNYDASLWFFSPRNKIRRTCQLLVPSSHGKRIYGIPHSKELNLAFKTIIYLCIITSVIIATIAVPAYIKENYVNLDGSFPRYTWFWCMDVALTMVFTAEFFIKIIADGFLLTPNAYMLNVWNQLDLFILITLYVNIAVGANASSSSISKVFRAIKSLRALSLIIPYAIYGTNIFAGLFYQCNDASASNKTQCVGEYIQSPFLQWNVLLPRVWNTPYSYSFDDFKSSFLILFEIVSEEGWVDVMSSSMQIAGRDLQPRPNVSVWNSVYFCVFNLAGAVFVLTMFVSVIVSNYQEKSGDAYLTEEQKRWMDLKKLLKQIKPSKRPKVRPQSRFRAFCFDCAAEKKGIWHKFITGVYILHILLLMTEIQDPAAWLDLTRNSKVDDEFDGINQLRKDYKQRKNTLEVDYLDVEKLKHRLSKIHSNKVYERRKTYNLVYQEALLSTERDVNGNEKGISFTNMLLMLAHYKLIDDEKCLEIQEYVKRKIKTDRVADNVNKDRVKSLLRTIYLRRKYKAIREQKLNAKKMNDTVPRIMVDIFNDEEEEEERTPGLRIDTNLILGMNSKIRISMSSASSPGSDGSPAGSSLNLFSSQNSSGDNSPRHSINT
ncbi:7815_t:CDS:2 [Acaulospora colombiana]|uniref:7815_t:CDS:1 n=1 Tax=Acaulospora colombiana TaxID=27376 RepID=A0ACA9LFA4_9GLOM|nr:7815_t:CDS:2 [Acaulospora colombiana]